MVAIRTIKRSKLQCSSNKLYQNYSVAVTSCIKIFRQRDLYSERRYCVRHEVICRRGGIALVILNIRDS